MILSTFLSIVFSLSSLPHIGHVAQQEYSFENETIQLKFLVEQGDLNSFAFQETCDFENMYSMCLANYINSKTDVTVNGQSLEFQLENSFSDNGHMILFLTSTTPVHTPKNLKISTRCFYEFHRSFKNRIILNFDSVQKSYLLRRKKNSIDVSL